MSTLAQKWQIFLLARHHLRVEARQVYDRKVSVKLGKNVSLQSTAKTIAGFYVPRAKRKKMHGSGPLTEPTAWMSVDAVAGVEIS